MARHPSLVVATVILLLLVQIILTSESSEEKSPTGQQDEHPVSGEGGHHTSPAPEDDSQSLITLDDDQPEAASGHTLNTHPKLVPLPLPLNESSLDQYLAYWKRQRDYSFQHRLPFWVQQGHAKNHLPSVPPVGLKSAQHRLEWERIQRLNAAIEAGQQAKNSIEAGRSFSQVTKSILMKRADNVEKFTRQHGLSPGFIHSKAKASRWTHPAVLALYGFTTGTLGFRFGWPLYQWLRRLRLPDDDLVNRPLVPATLQPINPDGPEDITTTKATDPSDVLPLDLAIIWALGIAIIIAIGATVIVGVYLLIRRRSSESGQKDFEVLPTMAK